MISLNSLRQKNKGNIRDCYLEQIEIRDNLKKAFKVYFKALNLNYIVSDYNNNDLRITCKNEVYPLNKLLDMFNLKYAIKNNGNNFKTYVIYVFKA